MSYVTGISGNVISAVSAGWAPTNSAEVSAIASAYATGKQDTLSFGYDVDKISAINNSGLVDTAALHSADYSSLYVQEPLYISSTGDSSYIGISGNVGGIDSATCSAIASAYVESGVSSKQDTLSFGYDNDKISAINGSALAGEVQVVTAVGTETAYTPDGVSNVVTGINGYYISALSADSAFQASYDENGRELTSLASEYDISSIASAYAESAVSSKADESALSGYYTTANESGFLTAVNSAGGVQVYATGTETSTNQFSAANASAGASIIAGTKARVRLWDSDYTGNMYASSIQEWNNKLDGSAIQYVAGSSDATANGVLYILTGNA